MRRRDTSIVSLLYHIFCQAAAAILLVYSQNNTSSVLGAPLSTSLHDHKSQIIGNNQRIISTDVFTSTSET